MSKKIVFLSVIVHLAIALILVNLVKKKFSKQTIVALTETQKKAPPKVQKSKVINHAVSYSGSKSSQGHSSPISIEAQRGNSDSDSEGIAIPVPNVPTPKPVPVPLKSPKRSPSKCLEEATKPHPVVRQPVEYPMAARAEGIEGRIVLKLIIASDGSVSNVLVLKSIPDLDNAVVEIVRQWRFSPSMRCGKAIDGGTWIIGMTFQLAD